MIAATKISQLEFSDLYLGHPSLDDRFSDVPAADANPLPAGPSLRNDLDQLIKVCRGELDAAPSAKEFKVSHDGVAYRVSVMKTLAGDVFVLRKIANTIFSLTELGIPRAYVRQLMTRDLSGLMVVSGSAKAGKTMTACAIVKDRLAAYGGIAVTGEDPVEMPLEGSYGQGVCFQTETPHSNQGFAEAFRHLTRWGAKIILVDEIRDPETAVEVLQASVSGHLIVTTMQAESLIQTITKLHSLANCILSPGSAQALMADGLLGVLHQEIVRGQKHKLETEFLFFKDAPVVKTVLRNGKYELLASDIKQQMASMIAENASIQRIVER
jgi:Tfp pilus assembly pilus retraction ATPase PilT